MKGEIDAVIGIALGLLTKAEMSCFRYQDVVCEFTTPGLNWKITKNKRGLKVDAHDAGNPYAWLAYTSTWGADSTEMQYVQLVHQALPDVLTNLVKFFQHLLNGLPLAQSSVSAVTDTIQLHVAKAPRCNPGAFHLEAI